MAAHEQRAHQRAAVALPVLIRIASGSEFSGKVENLGALGALVTTPDLEVAIVVGDQVTLVIETPDRGRVEAAGEVLRLEQEFTGTDIRRSFAVRFVEELQT
ncbi:MAG: PilZ domain-containing protein, partial [Planctomycetota bacterium]|jgi:hypothetical protein